MDSNTPSFLLNSSTFHSVFYQDKQDNDGIIDLGLSLMQPKAYNSSGNSMPPSPFSFFSPVFLQSSTTSFIFQFPFLSKCFFFFIMYVQLWNCLQQILCPKNRKTGFTIKILKAGSQSQSTLLSNCDSYEQCSQCNKHQLSLNNSF